MVVVNRVLMNVVLPRPDSPGKWEDRIARYGKKRLEEHVHRGLHVKETWFYTPYQSRTEHDIPQTINVKLAPRLATILWRWFGRLAMPMPAPTWVGAMVEGKVRGGGRGRRGGCC